MSKWVCNVCGFVHTGDTPPARCPRCNAPKEKFEPISDAVPSDD